MTPKSDQERGLKEVLKDIAAALGELLHGFLKWATRDFPWCPNGSGFHHWHRVGRKVRHEDNGSFRCRDYVKRFVIKKCCRCGKVKQVWRMWQTGKNHQD